MTDATALPCPGRRSPVRPAAVVPACRACVHWRWGSEFEAHRMPVATHDGTRWVCAEQELVNHVDTVAAAS